MSEPDAETVDQIRAVPFLSNNEVIQSLKDELPAYIVKASQIPDDFDTLSDSWLLVEVSSSRTTSVVFSDTEASGCTAIICSS